MNNKQLAEALRAIDMRALWIKDRAAILNAADALEIGEAVRSTTLEEAANICDENIDPAEAAFEIRALKLSNRGEA